MTGRKALGIVKLFLFGIFTFPFYAYSFFVNTNKSENKLKGAAVIRRWCKLVMPMMGFSTQQKGKPPKGAPYLFVANHRSSLDPLILMTG